MIRDAGLEACGKSFLAFVDQALDQARDDPGNLELKRQHSLEVLANAEAIAPTLDDPRARRLSLFAALLHDAGRFPQYLRFGTFSDARSMSHGRLGAWAIHRHGLADMLDPADRRVVVGSTALHNKRFLPDNMPRPLAEVVKVVRDADKLDIMRVMIAHFRAEQDGDEVVHLHVKPHPENYSPALCDAVMRGCQGDYRDMVWVNDFKLMILSWFSDINYRRSLELAVERGLHRQLLALLPRDETMRVLGATVLDRIDRALEG